MHNREHVIVLRPAKGILSHTMYYQDEIRQLEVRTDTSLVKTRNSTWRKC